MIAGISFLLTGIILLVVAYLLFFKEAYWLISGINFGPRQTVYERYDIPGLTRHMGRMCFLLSLIMLLSAAGFLAGSEMLILAPIGSIYIIIPIMLFGAERYTFEGRKKQRIINIAITLFMAVVAVFSIALMISGAKTPVIEVTDDSLVIESAYGTEIPLDSIRQVGMTSLEGKDIDKLNGFNFGDNLKGRFRVGDLGEITIYQQGEPCNSVLIKSDSGTFLINLGSEAENEDLLSRILDAVKYD